MQKLRIALLVGISSWTIFMTPACQTPSEDIVTEPFKVIGLTVISSLKEQQNTTDIGIFWGQLYAQNVLQRIPNKVSDDVYIVYTDYANNPDEGFRIIMGAKVSSLDSIPRGLTGRTISGGNYKKFIAHGEMPKAVNNLWSQIRLMDSTRLSRTYQADYEVYGRDRSSPDAEVDVFVSVK